MLLAQEATAYIVAGSARAPGFVPAHSHRSRQYPWIEAGLSKSLGAYSAGSASYILTSGQPPKRQGGDGRGWGIRYGGRVPTPGHGFSVGGVAAEAEVLQDKEAEAGADEKEKNRDVTKSVLLSIFGEVGQQIIFIMFKVSKTE